MNEAEGTQMTLTLGALQEWCKANGAAIVLNSDGTIYTSDDESGKSVRRDAKVMAELVGVPVGTGAYLAAPGYEMLADIYARAFAQAAHGKGVERHGNGLPFDKQAMQSISDLVGVGFTVGQAIKKAQEAMRLKPTNRAVAELLGAMNYLGGAVLYLERTGQVMAAANDNDGGEPFPSLQAHG